eukprot:3306719-Pyramimonas_sp.AAC.1
MSYYYYDHSYAHIRFQRLGGFKQRCSLQAHAPTATSGTASFIVRSVLCSVNDAVHVLACNENARGLSDKSNSMEKNYGRKPFAFMIPSVTGNTRYSQKTECCLSSLVVRDSSIDTRTWTQPWEYAAQPPPAANRRMLTH